MARIVKLRLREKCLEKFGQPEIGLGVPTILTDFTDDELRRTGTTSEDNARAPVTVNREAVKFPMTLYPIARGFRSEHGKCPTPEKGQRWRGLGWPG